MIIATFLRNYKVYSNLNFIPLIKSTENNLSIFIGPNGSGKSSVLEALDSVFNLREWNVSLGQKKQDSSVCPIFLLRKDENQNSKLETISNYFWNTDFTQMAGSGKPIIEFCKFRDDLKIKIDTEKFYLIPVGTTYDKKIIFTSSFDNAHFNHVRPKGISRLDLEKIKNEIYSKYSYIYIPMDLPTSELLSLQAREMQGLMDKSVVEEIRILLERKNHKAVGETKNQSIIMAINDSLSKYMDSINQEMGSSYEFGIKGTKKKTIKFSDFISTILNEFFAKRPLSKDGKEIKRLSSGEQRLALIDLAYTFLKRETPKNKSVILAIDEPEASLQDSLCLEQFHKLFEIGGKFGHQVIITTHWYGLLITSANGYLNCVEPRGNSAPTIKSLKLYKIHEERRSFPNQVEMKSFFDLISSMLSILKSKEHNWIICEGFDDVCYLKAHLSIDESTTTIIPLNGSGNVLKIFKFLRVPFEDKKENSLIKGKVLCITDTDPSDLIRIPDYSSKATDQKLDLWRWQFIPHKQEANLVNTNNNSSFPTEIEDCLNAETYYQAVWEAAKSNTDLQDILKDLKPSIDAQYSAFQSIGFLDHENLEDKAKEDLKLIISSEESKHIISREYLKIISPKNRDIFWANQILDFFQK